MEEEKKRLTDESEDQKEPDIERTLVLIKPDGMMYRDAIVRRLKHAGFVILQTRTIRLTPEQASEFYRCKTDHNDFPAMVVALTETPIQIMCVAKKNAVEEMKRMIGPSNYGDTKLFSPNSLRALFADNLDEMKNAIHVSDTSKDASYEIHFFFPNMILEPIHAQADVNCYLQGSVNATLMDALMELSKQRPPDPVLWLANYLMVNNPFKPKIYSASPESLQKIAEIEKKMKEFELERDQTKLQSEILSDIKEVSESLNSEKLE